MSVQSKIGFDIDAYRQAYESWDIPALLSHYADDVELTMISGDNPPSSPRTAVGKAVFSGMFEHCKGAGAEVTVENCVATEDRIAATVTCAFPGGRKVVANSIMDLRDGVIVHEREVVAGD